MSYPYEDSGGDWNSHTFPYNLSTFTASSNMHPDLPSEPPGYDEFEFSFPSELSPSLFSLPFMTENGRGILSPSGSSFPALSSTGHSPTAWAEHFFTAKSPTNAVAGPSNSSVQQGQHTRQDSAVIAKKLFEDDERSALDAFFNKTLDEAAKPGNDSVKEASALQDPSASPKSGGGNLEVEASAVATAAEQRKRSRKQSETSKNTRTTTAVRGSKAKRPTPIKVHKKEEPGAAKVETAEASDLTENQTSTKRSRTDSIANVGNAETTDSATLATTSANTKRTSHIASEQKRRSTIKDNYKTLVDMLLAGEATSGISLLGGGEDEEEGEGGPKKNKPKGRGRGRKGQDGAGATKSVVLERAADYLRWLDSGNQDLEKEIARLEVILAK